MHVLNFFFYIWRMNANFFFYLITSIESMRQTNYDYKSFLTHLPLKFPHYTVWKIQRGKTLKKCHRDKKFWRLIDNEHRLQFTNPNRMRTKIECLNKCCVKLSTDSRNYGCNHDHRIAVLNIVRRKRNENKRNGRDFHFFRINQIDWSALYRIRNERNKSLISYSGFG